MIQRNPYAIGYAEYGQAKRLGLRLAHLENQAQRFVAPDATTGLEALLRTKLSDNFRVFLPDPQGEASYPIVTYTWMLAHRQHADAKKAEAMRQYVEWCLPEGQADCDSRGFVRVPLEVTDRVLQEIRRIQ